MAKISKDLKYGTSSILQGLPFLKVLKLLNNRDLTLIKFICAFQIFLGFLDLVGVAAIGLIGALGLELISPAYATKRYDHILKFLKLEQLPAQTQIFVVVAVAVTVLLCKTALSIMFTRKTLFFLSRRGAGISANLVTRFLGKPLLFIQEKSSQSTLFSVTEGVQLLTVGVLGVGILLVADSATLVILSIGLLILNPVTFLFTAAIFTIMGVILHKQLSSRAGKLGQKNSQLTIESNQKIIEVLSTYREIFVKNRRRFYADEIASLRFEIADSYAQMNFLPYLSKYVIEFTVVLSAVILGVLQLAISNSAQAITTITIFLAAGTRIAPALLRVQQGYTQVKQSLGQSFATLDFIDSLGEDSQGKISISPLDFQHEGFQPVIEVRDVTFTYPKNNFKALDKVSFDVSAGSLVAVVGPSGSGKTTLIDILLGIIEPDEGQVSISNLKPFFAIEKWPGAIAYVPQDAQVVSGSIDANIHLGYSSSEVDFHRVHEAQKKSELSDFIEGLPLRGESQVGENGTFLSGGQKQRLGIARGLFTHPKLLVLDEATSALDSLTEQKISESLSNIRGETTIVMIAHRLSTVRSADLVIYLENGKIRATGTFDQVRKKVSDFDLQASLMGL